MLKRTVVLELVPPASQYISNCFAITWSGNKTTPHLQFSSDSFSSCKFDGSKFMLPPGRAVAYKTTL